MNDLISLQLLLKDEVVDRCGWGRALQGPKLKLR